MPFTPTFDPVEIVYEDDHILLVNKPSGMLVHTARNLEEENLIDHFKKRCDNPEIRAAHRLDRKTSGLVILAKTQASARFYGKALIARQLSKTYLALVRGQLKQKQGTLNNFLGRHPNSKVKIKRWVCDEGEEAITHFKAIKSSVDKSFVQLTPVTGRTHQLRVHMAYIGHPIIGDPIYDLGDDYFIAMLESSTPSPPMHLHAWKIAIPYMNSDSKILNIESSLPSFWKL